MSDPEIPILPAWPAFTRPTLEVLADGKVWRTADLRQAVADVMRLTDDQRVECLNSGQSRAENRVGWALSMLKRVKAATQVRNGYSEITEFGHQLLAEHPAELSERTLKAVPAYDTYVPKAHNRSGTEPVKDGQPYWFVGAYYADADPQDQTPRLIEQGIWENGYTDKYIDDVKSMEPGDRIAIKAAFQRKRDIPFDNKGHAVSVMAIKATGRITRNHGDGKTVGVDWDPQEPLREWYFYTNRLTVWRVLPGDWRADGLIAFTFEDEPQVIDRFRNSQFWAERFGGTALESYDQDDEAAETDEEERQGGDDAYSLTDVIADGCFIAQDTLAEYLSALRTKKNLILQGPPGTGKTWLAKRLGYALIGSKDRNLLRAIQFHPTLAYEDFVRGWRPSGDGKLTLEDGIFLDIVNAARADPGHPRVLVIEEINRGNLAQIFGELLTLLESEKRSPDEALELSYRRSDDEPMYLPDNLFIIGTMNLADRSLAIVDFALRRRFAFAELKPMFNSTWRQLVSDKNGVPTDFLDQLAGRVGALNSRIGDDRSLGEQYRIGHSFFTPHAKTKIDDPQAWLRRIVVREIRPLLSEYWFDDAERVEKEAALLLGESL